MDIIGLQEVPGGQYLTKLNRLAQMLGMDFRFAESSAAWGLLGNAVLSKYAFTSSLSLQLLGGQRSCMKTRMDVLGKPLEVHTIHLAIESEQHRLFQIREAYPNGEARETPHVLVGDLNAVSRSDYTPEGWKDMESYRARIGFPAPRSDLTDFVFSELKYRDAWKEAGSSFDKSIGTAPRGSFTSVVDYILLSPSLKEWTVIPGSYRIIHHEGLSDHNMVVVDLKWEASRNP